MKQFFSIAVILVTLVGCKKDIPHINQITEVKRVTTPRLYKEMRKRCQWKLTMPPTGGPGDGIPMSCTVPMSKVCNCGSAALVAPNQLLDIFGEVKDIKGLYDLPGENLNANDKFLELMNGAVKTERKRCNWEIFSSPTIPAETGLVFSCTSLAGENCNCGNSVQGSSDILVKYFPDNSIDELSTKSELLNENLAFIRYLNEISGDDNE